MADRSTGLWEEVCPFFSEKRQQMKVPGVPITPGSCESGQKGQEGALAEAPECVDISVWQKTRESSPFRERG